VVKRLFNILAFLKGFSHRNYRLLYTLSARNENGFLLSKPDFDLFIFSNPVRSGRSKRFFREFFDKCEPKNIEIIAETPQYRVFLYGENRICVYLFMEHNYALSIIEDSKIPISGFCSVQGYNDDFFERILQLTPDWGMRVITNQIDWEKLKIEGTDTADIVVKDTSYTVSLIYDAQRLPEIKEFLIVKKDAQIG